MLARLDASGTAVWLILRYALWHDADAWATVAEFGAAGVLQWLALEFLAPSIAENVGAIG